ncbi:MAG: hypothetical protein ABIQ39_08040, partial [Ilumatobacteraceae bacterium]
RSLAIAQVDIGKRGVIAGRSAALLHGRDGFNRGPVEVIVPRRHRRVVAAARVCSTRRELHRGDTVVVDGIRCLTAERTILEAPLFGFTRAEIENAVDSGIRLRRISEQRLRTRVVAMHHQSINGARALLDALVDSGGESRLERWMLRLIREAGLPRPVLQKTFHEGTRVVARVDMIFGNVVVEVAGHGTHSSRRQRQADEQRRTELLVRGYVVVTFTYDDVRDRPKWVVEQLRRVLAGSFCAA